MFMRPLIQTSKRFFLTSRIAASHFRFTRAIFPFTQLAPVGGSGFYTDAGLTADPELRFQPWGEAVRIRTVISAYHLE